MQRAMAVLLQLLLAALLVTAARSSDVGRSELRRIGNITEGPYQNYTGQPLINLGDNFYYFESNVKANWYNALEFCRNVGLHLAAIETVEENDLLVNHINEIGVQDYWLGGSDFGTVGTYVWTGTGKRATFFDWHSGEPNHDSGEHVVQLRLYNGVLKWNDERPYAAHGMICEHICDANCL